MDGGTSPLTSKYSDHGAPHYYYFTRTFETTVHLTLTERLLASTSSTAHFIRSHFSVHLTTSTSRASEVHRRLEGVRASEVHRRLEGAREVVS